MPAIDRRDVMRMSTAALMAALCLAAPSPAHADWFVSPFASGLFKGDATHKSTAVGIAGGWIGSWLGAEADLGWAPQFFEQGGFIGDRQVTTAMANLIVA